MICELGASAYRQPEIRQGDLVQGAADRILQRLKSALPKRKQSLRYLGFRLSGRLAMWIQHSLGFVTQDGWNLVTRITRPIPILRAGPRTSTQQKIRSGNRRLEKGIAVAAAIETPQGERTLYSRRSIVERGRTGKARVFTSTERAFHHDSFSQPFWLVIVCEWLLKVCR